MGLINKKEFKSHEKSLKKSVKGGKWDGRSRPTNELYKKNWERIFNNGKDKKNGKKE